MTHEEAHEVIWASCDTMSRELMKLNPAIPSVPDEDTRKVLFETVYRLTQDVETIKKRLLKLRNRDDSSLL